MRLLSGDRPFVLIMTSLALAGLAIYASASLGLLARGGSISRALILQAGLGLGLGVAAFFAVRALPLARIRPFVPHIYGASVLLTLLVFIPSLGFRAGGATRWIDLGFITIQPAEFLKIGFVLALAWWLAPRARKLKNMRQGLWPFVAFLTVPSVILLAQPNTSTTLLLLVTGAAMYFVAGAPWRDFGILAIIAVIALGAVIVARPYALERVRTFIDPSANALGSGYQIRQSLIAIGSGGLLGRGFGQGVEKFNYLPEADGDSVFAVFAEETGFVGAIILLTLFVALAARGFVIASKSADLFGGLVALGLSFLIIFQAFVNIGAMLGVVPLTGLPLPFVSNGGTALLAVFISCALILSVASPRRR